MIEAKTKQSILMLRQQGESLTEIAKLLSLSPNTVKSICHRSGIHTLPESWHKEKIFLLNGMPQCMVEQNPQPETIPLNLLLLRQGVYQLWE